MRRKRIRRPQQSELLKQEIQALKEEIHQLSAKNEENPNNLSVQIKEAYNSWGRWVLYGGLAIGAIWGARYIFRAIGGTIKSFNEMRRDCAS